MKGWFETCEANPEGMEDWDTSNVVNMDELFAFTTNFNRDLSQWCVSKIGAKPFWFDRYASQFTASNQPVWGTCPRGEDSA